MEIPTVNLPSAAIDPIPIRVGLYFDRWFVDHRLSVFVKAEGVTPYEIRRYVVDLGEPSITMINAAADALFSHTQRLGDAKWEAASTEGNIDAVLRPVITSVNLYEGNHIGYLFRLYTLQGEIIDEWQVSGRSSAPASGEGLADAMRHAAAEFMLRFSNSRKVKDWLKQAETSTKRNQPLDDGT